MSATSSQAAPQAAGPDLIVRRYESEQGRVFLTGTQALVRVLVDQARRDARAGLKTGGFVSGYRGSPLGGVDLELWRAASVIGEHGIEFLPAVNEDLAATAVLGSQQVETNPKRTVDGVFALWYGKGPGSTAPATRYAMAMPMAARRTAASWWWRATTTAACPRRCRTSPTWPS
ncbi:MAG: hypothetical protein R3E48_07040 [Burkholderiaceae bacterium]